MTRLLKILGMELIFLLLLFGFYQKGWTEERYTVKPGDTLYGISKSLGVGVETLKKANALEEESIKPKQVLTVPTRRGNKAADVAGKLSTRAGKKLPASIVDKALGERDSYVVEKGDSLSSISKKVGLSTKEIMMRNGLHTSDVKIGQTLLLARNASQTDDDGEDLEDGDEPAETEPAAFPPLGKWSNPDERNLLVRVAKAFLGVPYKLGGSTLKGIDCSALVKKIYEVFNIQLPRTAREQFTAGKRVEKDQLEEGDLVFFRRAGNRAHVGIYVGDDQFIHASSYSREVRIDHLNAPYYSQRFLKGVRVMELEREI
ncbi:MAG TPA: NlpC/P60 family protein [Thermodesulfobacteriota bacterium]|nr:NlpC/P60 family protein [Thermodesulfobacteriota bacterium]